MFLPNASGISLLGCAVVLSSLFAATLALAQSGDRVTRIPIPNSDFPISGAVVVPPGYETIYLSGTIAQPANPKATDPAEKYGDTKTQTVSVMKQIQATLEKQQLSMGDVVMMRVYLVGDSSKGGQMDFAGMMAGYKQYFGTTDQPNKPARSAVQVAALALPGLLVEIEVIAVRKHGAHAEPAGLK
jgi:enamine deaminase RidA (YjgF/YER057c/UK114 family)